MIRTGPVNPAIETSREANQSIRPLQYSATEAGPTNQRRLGLGPSNDAS